MILVIVVSSIHTQTTACGRGALRSSVDVALHFFIISIVSSFECWVTNGLRFRFVGVSGHRVH